MGALRTFAGAVLVGALLAGCGEDEPAEPAGLREVDRSLLAAACANDVTAARGTTALAHARQRGFEAIERILVEAGG